MRSDDPLDLLALISAMIMATDPSRSDPFARLGSAVQLGVLVDSFIGTPYAETTAALTALRALLPMR